MQHFDENEPPRILIAEDSPTQSAQLCAILQKQGYLVEAAVNGEEALAAARTNKPTLLISDVMMPVMNGYQLCKALKQDPALRDVPVILVTELSQPQDVVLGLECGADNFIRKPYAERYLMQRITHLLANRALRSGEKIQVGLEIDLRGNRYFVTAERQQILDLLISTYEEAVILKETLEASMQSLHGLYRIAEGLNECATLRESINTVLDRVTEMLGIEAAWCYLCDQGDDDRNAYLGSCGLSATQKAMAAAARCCGDLNRASRRPANIDNAEGPGGVAPAGLPPNARIPLWGKNGLLGALHVARKSGEIFSDEELEILHGVGQQVGLALERARLMEDLESLVDKRTAALRESEEWFRGVFQAQVDAVFVLDPARQIVDANEAAKRMFGHRLEDLRGRTAVILQTEQARFADFNARLDSSCASGDTAAFEYEFQRKGGEHFPGEFAFSLLRGAAGEVLGSVMVVRDITERKRAEAKLASVQEQFHHAQRMESLGVLAGGIAHDMNNILSAVIGFSDMALADTEPDSTLRSDIQCVREAGERGARLVSQILAFSRKQILEPAVLDLNDVVLRFRAMIARLIGENIVIRLALLDGAAPVLADASQVEQVLMNLAVNARDAMPGGGTLTIETRNVNFDEVYQVDHFTVQPGDYVMLSVADSGVGMSADTQRRIFEPFFTTKDLGHGTGLGLATVYGIVDQHKGYIHVYSEIGIGTVFKVYLPVTRQVDKQNNNDPAPVTPRTGTETILVVEDESAVRQLIARVLSRKGYTVIEADGPQAALDYVSANAGNVDLLVTDVIMPGMNGRELHLQLRNQRPGLKALYTSGYTHDVISQHALLEEGIHYLPKPFSSADLAEKVRQAIED